MAAILVQHCYLQPERLSTMRRLCNGLPTRSRLHVFMAGYYPGADHELYLEWEGMKMRWHIDAWIFVRYYDEYVAVHLAQELMHDAMTHLHSRQPGEVQPDFGDPELVQALERRMRRRGR